MELNTLIYEKDEGIGIITFNRQESLNAISSEFMSELNQVLDDIGSDDEIRVVIVTGGDKVFAAGADIKEVVNIGTPADAYCFSKKDQHVFQKLVNLRVPVIAAVAGLAYGGGCEIALQCDIRIAADNAKFAQPEIKLGILPGAGGTQRLPRLIGAGRAKELLFSGDPVDAQEAYRIGLVNKVVPAELLMEEAKKMAKTFSERPGYALMMIKQLVNTGINMDLNSALEYEARCFEILFSTEDQKEGLKAFIEKRKPVFQNR
jgi:enoyl-CoA hydratase